MTFKQTNYGSVRLKINFELLISAFECLKPEIGDLADWQVSNSPDALLSFRFRAFAKIEKQRLRLDEKTIALLFKKV